MGGERGAQEERNGIHLGGSFAPHWRALLSKAHYLLLRFIGEPNGSAALIRQQSMGGEREAQEERNGLCLGGSSAFHWRALSARVRRTPKFGPGVKL